MKTLKKYTTPKIEIIETEMKTSLLAGSSEHGNSDWAHENACSHGHDKWFCDDD